MKTYLPFSGFYESNWSAALDDAETQLADYFTGENDSGDGVEPFAGMDSATVCEAMFWAIDYRKAERSIAGEYVATFAHLVERETGWPLHLKFSDVDSPREYNFTTDRIEVELPRATVRRMRAETNDAPLRNIARERHTSGPGFISFYSPNVDTWGHVDTWDANQVQTLLLAWLESHDIEDIEGQCFDAIGGNSEYDDAVYGALDMDELKRRVSA